VFRRESFESIVVEEVGGRVPDVRDIEDAFGLLEGEEADGASGTGLEVELVDLFLCLRDLSSTVSKASSKSALPRFFSFEWMSFTICGRAFTRNLLTSLPPCPSKTPKRAERGQFSRKQS
jgi:hypothetical protein